MKARHSGDSDEEFHDCLSNVQYCAIASPRGKGVGEVFTDFNRARDKLKHLKGSRMKMFSDYQCAKQFALTPVENLCQENAYHPSPKADVEASPFPSVSQSMLIQLRACIEKGDIGMIHLLVDNNPLILVTSSDTPTLLQIRLRYNALHIAAACGSVEALECILAYVNSFNFWRRIYPVSTDLEALERQRRVIDLYLNSPELGNLETPLHFASKFGHVACARLLATHPLIQLEATNRSGETPSQVAGLRLRTAGQVKVNQSHHHSENEQPLICMNISRIFNQNFVVLVDLAIASQTESSKVSILAPISLRRLQSILVSTYGREFFGLKKLMPHYNWVLSTTSATTSNTTDDFCPSTVHNAGDAGILHVRAFSGPMSTSEAICFRSKWLLANSTPRWQAFASIRLTDDEKGYERQGRYFAQHFGYQWFEYWRFLDDFLDFSSEEGLSKFEEYLSTANDEITEPLRPKLNRLCNSTQATVQPHPHSGVVTSWSLSPPPWRPDRLEFIEDRYSPPGTPILCQNRRTNPSQPTPSSKVSPDPWLTYRLASATSKVLNDTLEESSQNTDNSTGEHSDCKTEDSKSPVLLLSPIVAMFEKLAFSSPLRWLLSEGPCSSQPLMQSLIGAAGQPHTQSQMANDLFRSKYKRRFSATANQHEASYTANEKAVNDHCYSEPVPKKSSPSRSTRQPKPSGELPPLIAHVYRSLPSGDLELQSAVVSIAVCADENSKPRRTPVMLNLPASKQNVRFEESPSVSTASKPGLFLVVHSFSRFENIRRWKHQIESFYL